MALHHREAKTWTTSSDREVPTDHTADSRDILLGNNSDVSTSARKQRTRHVPKFVWTFEVFCAVLSAASIVAIIALLKHYDGKALSNWTLHIGDGPDPVYISLNFIVSILSTLGKSTSAVVLSSCLSQLKWNWFSNRQRPLKDFKLFDDASRGPKGSVELLWRTKAIRLASVGAILTVLSLALDPFLQLLITYPVKEDQIPSGAGMIAYAQRFVQGDEVLDRMNPFEFEGGNYSRSTTSPYSGMVAAISNGLWIPDARQEPERECVNGNCTWPQYVSLAVCSSCFDISSYLVESTIEGYPCALDGNVAAVGARASVYGLEPHISLDVVLPPPKDDTIGDPCFKVGMDARATVDPKETINFRDSQTLLFSTAIIMVDTSLGSAPLAYSSGSNTISSATECGLQLCANTYDSRVVNGRFSENVVSSTSKRVSESWRVMSDFRDRTPANISINDSWNPPFYGATIPRDDFQLELSSAQRTIADMPAFNVSQGAIDSLMDYMLTLIPNHNKTSSQNGGILPTVIQERNITQYASLAVQAIYNSRSINDTFDNLATDMSTAIRNSGNVTTTGPAARLQAYPQAEYSLPPIQGFSTVYTVTISIRWGFIALPAMVCLLSFLYLIASIVQTSRLAIPHWKDGALAGLVWGLEQETREAAKATWTGSGADRAGEMAVMFRGGKTNGELVRASPHHP